MFGSRATNTRLTDDEILDEEEANETFQCCTEMFSRVIQENGNRKNEQEEEEEEEEFEWWLLPLQRRAMATTHQNGRKNVLQTPSSRKHDSEWKYLR